MNFVCPSHKSPLVFDFPAGNYVCPSGCSYARLNEIPRFVSRQGYVSSFGVQWNNYAKTQLDSYTGVPISKDRLTRLLGGALDIVGGKDVLEAGCGAGRFSEIMLEAGAHLYAVDLSEAVEANHGNCRKYKDYHVCQADILNLPFPPEQFDIVVCVGVVQHTPDPEKTMSSLCDQVKPGGMLVLDHYSYNYPLPLSRRILRPLLVHAHKEFALRFCKMLTTVLWPIHSLFWKLRDVPVFGKLRHVFVGASPLIDYHDAYPSLGPQLLKEWATLDTHDTLTDVYKHLRSTEEIASHLRRCGMVEIETAYAGNGVECRSRKPLRPAVQSVGPKPEGR